MSNVTIRDIKVILTEPDGIRLVIVKVETSEPGLYGVGCATFTQRPLPVKVAVENYLRPFLIGRNVSRHRGYLAIELRQFVLAQRRRAQQRAERGRSGLCGTSRAKWPVCRCMTSWGGRAREAAAVYVHASGREPAEVADKVSAFMGRGIPSHPRPGRHARIRDVTVRRAWINRPKPQVLPEALPAR